MAYSEEEESKDIIDCIIKFDKTATDYEKARYLEVIQRDLKKCKKISAPDSPYFIKVKRI